MAVAAAYQRGVSRFSRIFARSATACYFAPGRVNLIGEHIDYNGGLVLPCAIDRGIFAFIAVRSDDLVKCYAEGFEQQPLHCRLADLGQQQHSWHRLLSSCYQVIAAHGARFQHGFDLLLTTDLPTASGLSSSAAVCVLLLYWFNDYLGVGLDRCQIALAAQQAEQIGLGTKCGIMDQFIIANAEEGKALLLDCATLHYQQFDLAKLQLLIINSNKPRQLADSAYNRRREECQTILAECQQHAAGEISNLCQLPLAEYGYYRKMLTNELLQKRFRHVISEQQRTIAAAAALEKCDLPTLGQLLYRSHRSLRDDYQVSCPELDFVVDWLARQPEVYGARMIGAGFGGCVLAVIRSAVNLDELQHSYQRKFNYQLQCFISKPAAAVHRYYHFSR